MKSEFTLLAGYNAWANRRLYEAAATLADAAYRADRGAFFKSVHGTLNHLLVADRIWMRRLTGTGDAPNRLDVILYDDLAELRMAREAEDERIAAYVDGLAEEDLDGTVHYRTITYAGEFSQSRTSVLLHVFNHQTHHRGQVHAILTGLTGEAPSLDLLMFQRETGAGMR